MGMTRARKKLSVFYVRERHEKELKPSRFLVQAGLLEEKKDEGSH